MGDEPLEIISRERALADEIAALQAANRELRARKDALEALLDLSAGSVLEIDWRKRLEAALARREG